MPFRQHLRTSSAIVSFALFSCISLPAFAQQAGSSNNYNDLDTIYVTGSFIKRNSQENSASPLNVMTTANIGAQGLNNLGDLARNMTFNSGSELNTDAFTQNFSTGTSNVNLRNLGLSSTLVLLNGKRQTLSAAYADDGSTFVDTSTLMPLIMVDRVETLKDGGSAIYGTDAVSGVVNYITRKNFTGLEVQTGLQSTTSDSQRDYDISAIWGKELSNGANFVIAGSFLHREALRSSDRSELTSGTGISKSGQPGTLIFADQIANPADPGNNFDLLPIIDPYCGTSDYSIPSPVGDPIQTGASTSITPGTCNLQFDQFYDLVPQEDRIQLFTSFDSDVGDTMHLYVEAAYNNNQATRNNAPAFPIVSPVPVAVGDGAGGVLPNVPVEVQPLVQALNLSSILFVGRTLGANGEPFVSNHNNETFRIAGTLDGNLNEQVTWETSVSYSQNSYGINADDIKRNDYINALLTGAFNPFGTAFTTHPNSPEALSAITANNTLVGETSLFTVDAHLTADVMEIGDSGKMIQFALGGQFRREEMSYDWSEDYNGALGDGSNSVTEGVPFFQGPLSRFNGGNLMFLYGGPDYGGDRDIYALFGEFAIPLHDTLDLQVAARYENYGNGVNSFDPKFSALWRPMDWVSVRGSYSTAFRAPSLYNTVGVQTALNEITVPDGAGGSSSSFIPVTSNGNPNLNPEQASVFNLGFSIRPNNHLMFNVDYWRYDFSNLITQENSQSLVNSALGGDPASFAKLDLNDPTDPTSVFRVRTDVINSPSVLTDGIDVSTAYNFDVMGGATVTVGAEATYVFKYQAINQAGIAFDGAGSRNFNNFARSIPELRVNFNVGYQNDNHSANMFIRYIDSYLDDQNTVTVPSYTTVDLQYGYTFGDPDEAPLRATIGVINLFNKAVPRLQTNGGFDSKVHDPRQRMIYMRLSKQF